MTDRFKDFIPGLESPASFGFEITPSDTVPLSEPVRALNIAVSGYVRVETVSGDIVTLYIGAGAAFPIRVRQVFATGTDATGIVGLF